MTYLARHHHDTEQIKHTNKRSLTLPTVNKKKKEIGDYVLCRTIGRGASGRVKLGIHKITGEKVAIKMISRSQLTASSSTAKSVQRELAVLQLLHHPHLIDLRQVLQDTQYVYFVMEYLEGGELFHVLAERGRLPESEGRHLFLQLITALAWCHAHHITHRDLKPENILLDKEKKNLKIADFGMAAMQPINALLRTSCGSPHYASPEIVRGKRYDGTATDVWSCGAILYAIVTGHLPFDDEHMGRLLAKIKTGRYRPLPDYLSPDARDLIKRMLVVDPLKRMTMAEILQHPWLTNKSFLGTELRFFQQPSLEFNPVSDPELQLPMIQSSLDLDGRIWETLKVLWREKSEDEILNPPPTKSGSSVSLPLRRSSVIADDVLMTPPLRSSLRATDDVESYLLSTPYESSSVDTMSCCRTLELPPTPKSTTTTFAHRMDTLAQTEEARGSKADAADVFIMTKPVDTCISMPETRRSAWWLCSKDPVRLNWLDKTCNYFTQKAPQKIITIECLSKHECETAGKLHQVLEECYHGKLTGRMYPHEKIVWCGSMTKNERPLSFLCHMTKMMNSVQPKIRINFIQVGQGDNLESYMEELLQCLNKYEMESDWVTKTNGWIHPEIL
ncbi:kinase-like domain-containing protein [Mucor mucedo]|uniref:kinase-like domain-containing protein n=1 Tax=Mucor mucedo TaxID=29922 RepID=UPI002220EEC2|nr:kinase-like domain-containing protein [Mucor mucedo]KAI7892847.1 kinase-like domain-containing protein [Mucor mucedo]